MHPWRKATDQQVLDAYAAAGGVRAAGKLLGLCGQSVHSRLVKLGASRPLPVFTVADDARLRADYNAHADTGTIHVLAAAMGRSKAVLCTRASQLGLTDRNRLRPHCGEGQRQRRLGKLASAETKAKMSDSMARALAARTPEQKAAHLRNISLAKAFGGNSSPAPRNASWRAGKREIGGREYHFRSLWEANYARYLEWRVARGEIVEWEYEPTEFWFGSEAEGIGIYRPDFRVRVLEGSNEVHEVKGWHCERSAQKLALMAQWYPTVPVILIDADTYRALAVAHADRVPGWEHEGRTVHTRKARQQAVANLL